MMQQQQPMPNSQQAQKAMPAPAFAKKDAPPANALIGLDQKNHAQ
jgi:hypothetical protein